MRLYLQVLWSHRPKLGKPNISWILVIALVLMTCGCRCCEGQTHSDMSISIDVQRSVAHP